MRCSSLLQSQRVGRDSQEMLWHSFGSWWALCRMSWPRSPANALVPAGGSPVPLKPMGWHETLVSMSRGPWEIFGAAQLTSASADLMHPRQPPGTQNCCFGYICGTAATVSTVFFCSTYVLAKPMHNSASHCCVIYFFASFFNISLLGVRCHTEHSAICLGGLKHTVYEISVPTSVV